MRFRYLFFGLFGILILITAWLFWYAKSSYTILPIKQVEEQNAQISSYALWQKYTPPSEAFTVMLPTIPQHATEKVVDEKTKATRLYNMYIAEKSDGTLFLINLITFVDGLPKDKLESTMALIMEEIVQRDPNIILAFVKKEGFDGMPGLNFSYDKEKIFVQAQLFGKDNVIYMLSSMGNKETFNPEDYNYFINSFEINHEN